MLLRLHIVYALLLDNSITLVLLHDDVLLLSRRDLAELIQPLLILF